MYREIKEKEIKDVDPEVIVWDREDKGYLETPVMYSFPQPGEIIKEKKFFVVKDYEKALFYNKGELVGTLGGGFYKIEKKARMKGTEIIYRYISSRGSMGYSTSERHTNQGWLYSWPLWRF